MGDLERPRINLDESKIEDDDMVEIVFQLTNFADKSQVATTPSRSAQSPPASNVYPTRIGGAVGQKRQNSIDQSELSHQTAAKTTVTTHSQHTQNTHIQRTVQISTTKTVTVQDNNRINIPSERSNRPRKKKTRSKSDLGLFKMFKTQGSQVTADVRQSGDGAEKPDLAVSEMEGKSETVNPRKCFVHYDSQSIMVDFNPNSITMSANNFANLKSGAATACLDDLVEEDSDSLLLETPNFNNEIFEETNLQVCPSGSTLKKCPKHKVCVFEGSPASRSAHGSNRDKLLASINLSDFTVDRRFLNFEHMDHGTNYYRRHFADHDHVNYFGVSEPHGPLAISIQREKTDIGAERGEAIYQFRIIIRSATMPTLRGSILEDFLPTSRGNGKAQVRDILECLAPEIKQENLKLAENKVAVVDELLKFDEITLNITYKVGLVYCKAGQRTEEEMYNNDVGSPAFEEFMDTIGERVTLKGFDSFRAGLDNKSDTTGTHSLYTRYNNTQIMFHVSTMLPYTENDRQQVVRKRHIGNDIVTVVFQEPGSLPFTPAHFRSHYQHVFIVVRAHSPNTPDTNYEIAVTRSEEVPEFGPPIPEKTMKKKNAAFRHFLLTKIINAENASLKAKKLALMAKRTREQLLNSFCETLCTSTTLVPATGKRGNAAMPAGKLGRSWSLKRKARFQQRLAPELVSRGALKWNVSVVEVGTEKPCILAISPAQIVIVEQKTKNMIYMLPCKAVLGWTSNADQLKLYYDTGEVIVMKRDTSSIDDDSTNDIDDIVKRLTCVSEGCETQEITVIKNQAGKLGFHIQFQGIVGDVTENGPAWAAGLRPSSRLLEVRGLLVAHLEHEQLITHLKGKDSIVVMALPPFPDGQPRRSISQLQSPTEMRSKAASVTARPQPAPVVTARAAAVPEQQQQPPTEQEEDSIAPLVDRRTVTPDENSRPSSRESVSRIMTRGSMIALNLLEQELGIEDDEKHMDIDQLLESIVGKDNISELEKEVKELEARSVSSSRPQTPNHYTSEQSLVSGGEDTPSGAGSPAVRHKSYVFSPSTARRTEVQSSAPPPRASDSVGKRYALGSSPAPGKRYALGSDTNLETNTGKRYALGSDNLEPRRDVIGAEQRHNGHAAVNEENNTAHDKPDISEIFKIIDKTRLESEANNRSPTDDISEIDAVVSMIEKVLENTDTYLEDMTTTRGLPSDSDTDNIVADAPPRPSPAGPPSSSPYSSFRHTPRNGARHDDATSPNKTLTGSPHFNKPTNNKVENIQRKMADYNEDMTRAIEQLDSINLDTRRTSLSSSSLSEEAVTVSPLSTSDHRDDEEEEESEKAASTIGSESELSGAEELQCTCNLIIEDPSPLRARSQAVSAKSSRDYLRATQRANPPPQLLGVRASKRLERLESENVEEQLSEQSYQLESSPEAPDDVIESSPETPADDDVIRYDPPNNKSLLQPTKSKSLGDMFPYTRALCSPNANTSDSVNINTESEQSTSDEEYPQRHYTMRRMRREGLLMEPASDNSDHSRTSDDIPPSPLQMLMERAREAQLDQTSESDNSWVRTTLLRIAELEAALERSNFELQILRKQNREMEQTLEIVDEENAKIRREMDRTNTQLSTFTQWVQSRQLL